MEEDEWNLKEIQSKIEIILKHFEEADFRCFGNYLLFYNKLTPFELKFQSKYLNFRPGGDNKEIRFKLMNEWDNAVRNCPNGYYPVQISGIKKLHQRANLNKFAFSKTFEIIAETFSKCKSDVVHDYFYSAENLFLDLKIKQNKIRKLKFNITKKLEIVATRLGKVKEDFGLTNLLKNKFMHLLSELNLGKGLNKSDLLIVKAESCILKREKRELKAKKFKRKIKEMTQALEELSHKLAGDYNYLEFMKETLKNPISFSEKKERTFFDINASIREFENINKEEEKDVRRSRSFDFRNIFSLENPEDVIEKNNHLLKICDFNENN